ENREGHDEVLHMSIRDEHPRSDGNSHDCGTEKADEPRIRGQALRLKVEELAARRGERNEEDERDEIEEALRRDSERRPGDDEEETRIRDLPCRPGRPSPWASETLNDDRTEHHEEEEVEGQMMCRDQSPRDEDERDHGRTIGPKAEKEEEAREGEQISDGRGG